MPKYLIERKVPGVGKLSGRDLHAMSLKSNNVLDKLGTDIQWQQSYVTEDKLYCVYIARDEDLIREHAKRGGFPLSNIYPIHTMIDPTTGDQ